MGSLPILAGFLATAIFTASALPMLAKAHRTRDLGSYSLGNIGLANVGNLVQSVYVLSLPPGPIWALHAFQLSTTGLMLGWYLRYGRAIRPHLHEPAHAAAGGVGWIARRGQAAGVPSVVTPLTDRSTT